MFLNNSSITRPPPSLLPGFDGTRSPAFKRYYEAAKTTGFVLRHSVCHVAPQYLGLISNCSLAVAGKPPPQRQGVVQPVAPSDSGVLSPRTPSVLPSSLRTLADLYRALGLRSVPRARSSAALGCRPRKLLPRGHRSTVTFGALSHGLSHSCLRFVPPSRTTTQNSLPVVDQPFRVGFFIPQNSFGEFHTFTRSPLPGLFLARSNSHLVGRRAPSRAVWLQQTRILERRATERVALPVGGMPK
jgi:hypothetical protein